PMPSKKPPMTAWPSSPDQRSTAPSPSTWSRTTRRISRSTKKKRKWATPLAAMPRRRCPRCTSISRARRISAVWARLESADMRCAGRALPVRPASAVRLAVLSLVLLVLAVPAEARLIAPEIDAVAASPPSNAQVPLSLTLKDEAGVERTLGAAVADTPAVLILAEYGCQALCGPVLALAATSLERSGLQAGKDYRLVVIGLDPRKGPAQAKAMKAAQIGENGPLAEATTLLSADDVTLRQVTTALGYRSAYDAEN